MSRNTDLPMRPHFRARRELSRARSALARGLRLRSSQPARGHREEHYRARLQQEIDPNLAVFAAYWYRGYFCNPRAIYERARERVPDLHGVWVVKRGLENTMPA